MAICINRNAVEYQLLKERANISSVILDLKCKEFLGKYNRFPHLDELPGSNSEQYLRDKLKLRKNNSTSIKNILEFTNSNSIDEAVTRLNDQYRDKEIKIIPIVEDAIVKIADRPTEGKPNITKINTPDSDINSAETITSALYKLSELYGIKTIQVTDAELSSAEWKDLMPRNRFVNAFIYKGNIYINIDRASVDAPIHELLHLFVGSMRFTNPNLYQALIQSAEMLPNYQNFLSEYQDKTRNDANEEIFIQELAKFLVGMESDFDTMSEATLYEIKYNVGRVLDSILMGDLSAKTLTPDFLYNASLKEIADYTNSNIMTNYYSGTLGLEGSELHRQLNNMKSDLLKKGQLKEICD